MCSIDANGDRACIPKGTQPIGAVCSATNECSPGSMCINQGGAQTVSCLEFCDSDAQCTGPGGLCLIQLDDGSGNAIPGVTFCSQNCDPTTNSGCSGIPSTGCQVAQDSVSQALFTVCSPAGAGGDTAPCTDNSSCKPGFGCFTVGTANQCLQWCKVNGAACTISGTSCQDLGANIGGTEYGACN